MSTSGQPKQRPSSQSGDIMNPTVAPSSSLTKRDTALQSAVVDAAIDGIIMMDQDGLVVEFNPAAEKIFGYKRHKVIGQSLVDILIPENIRTVYDSKLERYLKIVQGTIIGKRVEVEAINARGEKLWIELAISPVDFKGATFFSVYLRDVTSIKAEVKKLQASEIHFQSLFEMYADGIIVHDADGRILDVNPKACELLRRSKQTFMDLKTFDLHTADQHDAALRARVEASNFETVRSEIDFLQPDGSLIPMEVFARRIETSDSVVFFSVLRDISVSPVVEQKLGQAKKDAERANNAKSGFFVNLLREMREPLNGIMGSLSLMEMSELQEKNTGFVITAKKSVETLLPLIEGLLDLSRMEAREIDVELTELDPEESMSVIQEVYASSVAPTLNGDHDRALKSSMDSYVAKPMKDCALHDDIQKRRLSDHQALANQATIGLDRDAIAELWSGDEETYSYIAGIFIEELNWRLPGISDTHQKDLEHQAHSLKGAAANVGATQLSILAGRLELLAKSVEMKDARSLISQITCEAETVRQQLKADYIESKFNG